LATSELSPAQSAGCRSTKSTASTKFMVMRESVDKSARQIVACIMWIREASLMRTFKDLIAAWETKRAFAQEVGVTYAAAKKMSERNNIRHEHWHGVMAAARARGIQLTADDLMRMSKRRRREWTGRGGSPRAAA